MNTPVIDRPGWGARSPKRTGPTLERVPYGVVHHIGGGPGYPADVASTLRAIQANELAGAYVDIAYSLGADNEGRVWVLRGGVSDGATLGFAGRSVSVLAICNAAVPGFVPSAQLVATIAAAFKYAVARGWLAAAPSIDGHHVFDAKVTTHPTACPGELETEIPRIRAAFGAHAPAPIIGPHAGPAAPPPKALLLRLGSRGPQVGDVQTCLSKWAWLAAYTGHQAAGNAMNPNGVDGIFGKNTDRAVRAFQHQAALAVDGIVGPVTWTALHAI